jgi:heme/copper-type cytochrome/quinol oxidase subunit 1
MEDFVRHFIRSSLVWLGTGVLLGIWMAVDPGGALVYRAAHMHANLLGFVSMMIFGVAYHVLPRFAGQPLRSRKAALTHLVLANAGLAAMVAGFMTRLSSYGVGTALLIAGALLSGTGAFLFIANIWATLEAPRSVAMPAAAGRGRGLPVHGG